jgi:uncharacterized membrane protein
MVRIYVAIALVLTIATAVASVVLYPHMPDQIPTHWNIQGEVDDYGSKEWAIFLLPGIMVLMIVLFRVLEWASPRQFTVENFRPTYYFVLLILVALMAFIHALMLWTAVAGPVDTTRVLIAGMCLFFAMLGAVLGRVQRNFWVGVRTPWTIASERVWKDTHRLAAWLFVVAGMLGFVIALVVPANSVATVSLFVLIMSAALVPVFYSLILYKMLERRGEL